MLIKPDSKAMAVKGVKQVIAVPNGVAVVADNFWSAKQGRGALNIEWDLGDGAGRLCGICTYSIAIR